MSDSAKPLPYGRQTIDDDDIAVVVEALRSDWLTTGPKVGEFERAFAAITETAEAVVVNSGTAALHAAMRAIGVGPNDEVIVPAITFAATSNAVLYEGGVPVFADVDPKTLLIDLNDVQAKINPRTKAIVAVDYAGQPCDYPSLRAIADQHGLKLVADACHALGAKLNGQSIGGLADLSAFSLHPVKPITTAEGGAITTNDPALAAKMRVFRNHGITTDHRQREAKGSWIYEMVELGYNYRLSDLQCALGINQLRKLSAWTNRRREIAARYQGLFQNVPGIEPLLTRDNVEHAYHLFVVQIDPEIFGMNRASAFQALRTRGIGVNVHYVPVYLHPYYQKLGYAAGLCPQAEAAYDRILSLPIYPTMTDQDVDRVVENFADLSQR